MKKRLLSWLLVAAMATSMVPAGTVQAFAANLPRASTTDKAGIQLPTNYTATYDVTQETANSIEIAKGGVYKLTGTNDECSIEISTTDEVTLVLDNLKLSNNVSPIQLMDGANVTMVLPEGSDSTIACAATEITVDKTADSSAEDTDNIDGDMMLVQGNHGMTAGINVPKNASLTVDKVLGQKTGKITVQGGYGGAGIGGGAATGLNDEKRGTSSQAGGMGTKQGYTMRPQYVTKGGTGGVLGGRYGNDAESSGTVTIKHVTVTAKGGYGGAGIGGGLGANGEAGKAGNNDAKNGSVNYGGGGGATGSNGGSGGNGGGQGTLVVEDATLTALGGTGGAGIGGGLGGTGAVGGAGMPGAAGGPVKTLQYGATNGAGGRGGHGSNGQTGLTGGGGNGGSVTIKNSRVTAQGANGIGQGEKYVTPTGAPGYSRGSGGQQGNKVQIETDHENGNYMEIGGGYGGDGGNGGTIGYNPAPVTTPASVNIADSDVKILNADGTTISGANSRPVGNQAAGGTSETLYHARIKVMQLDNTTPIANAEINMPVHRTDDSLRQYNYQTTTDADGYADVWLPAGEGYYVEDMEVSHRAIGRILKGQKYYMNNEDKDKNNDGKMLPNDNNTMTVLIGVDISIDISPKETKVYDKDVNLLVYGNTVPSDMDIVGIRWFRERVNNNDAVYTTDKKADVNNSNALAYTNGFKKALANNKQNTGSTFAADLAGNTISMEPETSKEKGRIWTLPMNQNGRYWVELQYRAVTIDDDGNKHYEETQSIVKSITIVNRFTSYPIKVRGAFVKYNESGESTLTSWLYGTKDDPNFDDYYVPLKENNGGARTEPYGFAWDLDSYDLSKLDAHIADHTINRDIITTENLKANGNFVPDEIQFQPISSYSTFYNASLGRKNIPLQETSKGDGTNSALAKPHPVTLNADFFTNNGICDTTEDGREQYDRYTVYYSARDGALNIVFSSGIDEATGEQLWEKQDQLLFSLKEANISGMEWPGYKLTRVTKTVWNEDGSEPKDVDITASMMDNMTFFIDDVPHTSNLKFYFKKWTSNVTMKAYWKVGEDGKEEEIEGISPQIAEAEIDKKYKPKDMTMQGYTLVGSNLDEDGTWTVKENEDENLIKFYYTKDTSNVTYQAVVDGTQEVIWKDGTSKSINKDNAPEDNIPAADLVQYYTPKYTDKANTKVETKITWMDGTTEASKYDGVHPLLVTYTYVPKMKDVTLKLVDANTQKEIGSKKENVQTGKDHLFTAPEQTGYKAVFLNWKAFVDLDENQTITFYYTASEKAEVTVNLVYHTTTADNQRVRNVINSFTQTGEWGAEMTIKKPDVTGYGWTDKTKDSVTTTPTRTMGEDGQYTVENTSVDIEYTPVTDDVTIKLVDGEGNSLNALVENNYKLTYQVKQGENFSASAPSITGYKLKDKSTLTQTLTAEQIKAGKKTITFTYEKIGADDLVKVKVIGVGPKNDKANPLYTYEKLLPVGTTDTIRAFSQVNLKVQSATVGGQTNPATTAGEVVVNTADNNAGDVIEVVFTYVNNTAKITVKALMLDNGNATTESVPGYKEITLEGVIGETFGYTAPDLLGYSYVKVDDEVSSITVDKSADKNVLKFYYNKNEGLVTYKAVDENNKDLHYSKSVTLKPGAEVQTGTEMAPTVPNYVLKTDTAAKVEGATDGKFNGKNAVTVTFTYVKRTKTVEIVKINSATNKPIGTENSQSYDAGTTQTIAAPNVTDFTAKTSTQTVFIADNDDKQSVTFYYDPVPDSRAQITVTMVDEKKNVIGSYQLIGDYGVETTIPVPNMKEKGYNYTTGETTVTITPDKDNPESCKKTLEYTTVKHQVTVNIAPDEAKTALGDNFTTIYYVKHNDPFSVTAPSITEWSLKAGVDLNQSIDKVDKDATLTFTYVKTDAAVNSTHTIIGKNGQNEIYSFTKTVKKNGGTTTYTATPLPGYTVTPETKTVSNDTDEKIEFSYTTNAATVKVVPVGTDGNQITGLEPVVYSGYEMGQQNVTIRVPAYEGYTLVGRYTDTGTTEDVGTTYTLNLAADKAENEVKFVYKQKNANGVTFMLKCADTKDGHGEIIRMIDGVAGQEYSVAEGGKLNLSADGFDFDASNTGNSPDFKRATSVTLPDPLEAKTYTLYYNHQTQNLTYKYILDDDNSKEWTNTNETNPSSAYVNETLTVSAPQIPGYTAKTPNQTVIVKKQTNGTAQTIEFHYTKKATGSITVNHVCDGVTFETYTVTVSDGEWFTANKVNNPKYALKNGQQASQTVAASKDKDTTITFEYDKNFVTVATYTDIGAGETPHQSNLEVIKGEDLELTPPARTGYVLKGIKITANDTTTGGENVIPNNYQNDKLTLSNLQNNTKVVYCYKSIADSLPEYQVTITVKGKYEKYDLGEAKTYTVAKSTSDTTTAYAAGTYNGYKVKSYKIDEGAEVTNLEQNFTGAKVDHKQNHTITYYYELEDGSNNVVVPGPDKKIPSGDDVTIKPIGAEKPKIDEDGNVTVPDGGGKVEKPDGTVEVPGGTIIDKEGNIKDPDNGNAPINPEKPGDGYFVVKYVANGGTGNAYIQIAKKNETVTVKDVSDLFKRADHTANGWNEDDQGLGTAYKANDTVDKTVTLYAQWTKKATPDGAWSAEVVTKPNNGVSGVQDVRYFVSSKVSETFKAKLKANTFTLPDWTFTRWYDQKNSTYHVDQDIVTVTANDTLTLTAQWIKYNADGSITVPGKDDLPNTKNDATANGIGTENPKYDNTTGIITIPAGGSVTVDGKKYPMPDGGTLKPNGEISIKQPKPDGGEIIVKPNPDGSTDTEVKDNMGSTDPNKTAYTVTYKSGVAAIEDVVMTFIGKTTVVNGDTLFTREGYKFAYWKNNDKIIAVGSELMANTELTANWYQVGENGEIIVKPDPDTDNEVTVKPDPDGNGPTIDKDGNVDVKPGGEIDVKPTPDNNGNGSITLPDGGTVKPDGKIEIPDNSGNKTEFDPSDPNTWPEGYFAVIYKANDDKATGSMAMQFLKNQGNALTCAFQNDGKTFVMWNTDNKGVGIAYKENAEITKPTDGTKKITLYAIWTIDQTKNPNGDGSITVPGPDAVLGGDPSDDVTIKPNGENKPSWKDDMSGVNVPNGGAVKYPDAEIVPPNGSWVKPDGTLVLPDKTEVKPNKPNEDIAGYVKVTYHPNKYGEGTMPTQVVKQGEAVVLLANTFTAKGMVFNGWNTVSNGSGDSYTHEQRIAKLDNDLTLYAQWADKLADHYATVNFYSNNGKSESATQTIDSIDAPVDGKIKGALQKNTFVLDGWKFNGWNTQQNGNGTYYADGAMITLKDKGMTNLYAMWIKVGADGSITVPGSDNKPGTDKDVIAKPNPDDSTKVPETDDKGNVKVPDGGSVVTPDKEITLPGGGTLKPDGTIEIPKKDGSTEVIDPTKPNQVPDGFYAVTYEPGVTDLKDVVVYVENGQTVKVAENMFSRTGYVFAYWKNTAENKIVKVGEELTTTTVLTANWYKQNDKGEITVPTQPDGEVVVKPDPNDPNKKPTVDKDGNVDVKPGGEVEKKPDGGTVVLPDGGKVEPDGTIKDDKGNTIDPDKPDSLPDGWYVVTYDANGGQGTMSKQTGKDLRALENRYVYDGKSFTAWNTEKSGSGDVYNVGRVIKPAQDAKEITLYAQWKSNASTNPTISVDIVFYSDADKTESATQTETTDGTQMVRQLQANSFKAPVDGWSFFGWNTKSNGTGTYYANEAKVLLKEGDKLELYAIWYKEDGDNIVIPGPDAKPAKPGETYDVIDDITIKPAPGGTEKPKPDGNGSIKVPDGGQIEIPSKTNPDKKTTITVTPGATVTPDGTITLPAGGKATVEPDGKEITGPAVIKPDGTVENPDANKPYRPGDGTIVLPGKDGKTDTKDDVIVTPSKDKDDKDNSSIDKDTGNVTLPDGGEVKYPEAPDGNGSTVIVPPGTVIAPDGTITLPDGVNGVIKNPDGSETVVPGPAVIKPDGTIEYPKSDKPSRRDDGTIVLPGKDGTTGTEDDVIVTPSKDKDGNDNSTIDKNGNVTLPDGGEVKYPDAPNGNGSTVIAPPGTVIAPDGTITLPDGGTAIIKPGDTEITGPATIKPDGTVEYPTDNKPSRRDDGTIVLPGKDGEINTKDDVITTPSKNNDGKDNSTIDKNGNVTLPDGGEVKYPDAPNGNGSTVIAPPGTVIAPDGTITLPDDKDGSIKNPDGTETVVPGGSEIGSDGTVKTYAYTVKFVGVTRDPQIVKIAAGAKKTISAPHVNGYSVDHETVTVTGGETIDGGYTITFTYTVQSNGGSTGGGGGGGSSITSYVITATAGNGGSISPAGNVSVNRGSDKVFTISANTGYRVSDVLVDGKSVGAVTTYTFNNVQAKHTIDVSFVKNADTNTAIGPAESGVDQWLRTGEHSAYMTGFGNGKFGPENSVTRAQIAQIFYRLLKDQNVDITVSFTDVSSDAWYAEAVNVLGSLGIVSGVGNGKFMPNRPITRAEFCAIATRFAKATSTVSNPFSDVSEKDWFYNAVATAASYGWVTGMSDGNFHPNAVINRAQAVTIINRMLGAAADRAYVDSHVNNPYTDVSTTFWGYYQIIEASISHNHSFDADGTEIWNSLK